MNVPPRLRTSYVWKDGRPDQAVHLLYLHLDANGTVLYVGLTGDMPKRHTAHRRESAWWPQVARVIEVGPYPYELGHDVERFVIEQLDPPHNVVFTTRWPVALAAATKTRQARYLAKQRAA